jgi:hypothetical protein
MMSAFIDVQLRYLTKLSAVILASTALLLSVMRALSSCCPLLAA